MSWRQIITTTGYDVLVWGCVLAGNGAGGLEVVARDHAHHDPRALAVLDRCRHLHQAHASVSRQAVLHAEPLGT